MRYVELHAHSAYSFLDGASLPEELVVRAAELRYEALALTDHDGIYGSLEFAHAAKAFDVRPITGAEVTLAGGCHVTLLVESPRGYSNLCRLLTAAHKDTRPPGRETEPVPPALEQALLEELHEGLVCLSGCARNGLAVHNPNAAARLAQAFGRDRFFVELQRPYERGDVRRNAALRDLAASLGVATVATGDPHAHAQGRTALQDVLVAIRNRTSLEGCERERRGNHESVLVAPAEAAERFPDDADAVARTLELADRLEFDLTQELGYRYPDFSDGEEPAIVQLRRVCDRAFADRYTGLNGHKRRAQARLEEELALIEELGLAGFFLLHWEVLELAREVALAVRGGSGARAPGRRPRTARARDRRLERAQGGGGARHASGRRPQARLAPLARVRRGLPRDRRPAAAHLAASGRDGHLVAPAERARSGAAVRDGGSADVPVGQGLVRRCRVPEDRPAGPRHALGGRGLRRADR